MNVFGLSGVATVIFLGFDGCACVIDRRAGLAGGLCCADGMARAATMESAWPR
jgi:hypothetical protein